MSTSLIILRFMYKIHRWKKKRGEKHGRFQTSKNFQFMHHLWPIVEVRTLQSLSGTIPTRIIWFLLQPQPQPQFHQFLNPVFPIPCNNNNLLRASLSGRRRKVGIDSIPFLVFNFVAKYDLGLVSFCLTIFLIVPILLQLPRNPRGTLVFSLCQPHAIIPHPGNLMVIKKICSFFTSWLGFLDIFNLFQFKPLKTFFNRFWS